jgi:hypothetical protein
MLLLGFACDVADVWNAIMLATKRTIRTLAVLLLLPNAECDPTRHSFAGHAMVAACSTAQERRQTALEHRDSSCPRNRERRFTVDTLGSHTVSVCPL